MTNEIKKEVVTKEYYDEIKNEYKRLIEVDRPEVIAELAAARAQGDLSENADYDSARAKQGEIEARIRDLEFILNNVEVAGESSSRVSVVNATSKVVIFDEEENEELTYEIVGSMGSDPEANKISTECALGSALIGKKVGDEVEIICGDGSSYKVIIRKIF